MEKTDTKYKLVYIEWGDAVSKDEWFLKKDALDWAERENWIVKQCGWLVKETGKYLVLASKVMETNYDTLEQIGYLFKIPKGWIKKRKILKI